MEKYKPRANEYVSLHKVLYYYRYFSINKCREQP